MAKKQALVLGPQMALFGEVHWFKPMNTRPLKDYGVADDSEVKEIVSSLAVNGWYDRQTVNVGPIDYNGFGEIPNLLEKAMLEREHLLTHLAEQAEKDQNARDLLYVYNKAWRDADGKIIEPKFFGNMCFRRASVYVQAMVNRLKIDQGMKFGPEEIPLMIPVNVKVYQTEADRIDDQFIENERNSVGKKEVSFPAKVMASKILFEAGRNEAHFRKRIFKDGVGQKVFAILKLNAVCPDFKLLDRIQLDPTDPQYIPGQSLPPGELRNLYTNKESKSGRIPSVDEVQLKIDEILGNKGNKPKMAERGVIEGLRDQNPNLVVRRVCEHLLNNQPDKIAQEFSHVSAHFDEVNRIVGLGKGAELLAYLKAFPVKA
jgi:hypothetical protein